GDEDGNLAFVIATGIDITEQKKAEDELLAQQKNLEKLVAARTAELQEANEKLELIANQDALTGLYNRRYFNNTLQNEIRRAQRHHAPLSLLMCDIDYYKNYNDTYGHIAGDKCLQTIANLIKKHFQRASDLVARYGGEEFCIILPDIDAPQASLLSEQLLKVVSQQQIQHESSPIADFVTISIGLVTGLDAERCDTISLLEHADKALYLAKKSGRNRIESVLIPTDK
ncbi:MAG: GGDEF domain-containing protein, partial [Thioalkalispiraceae bacterium]